MHSYSLDTDARKTVIFFLVLGAIGLSGSITSLASQLEIPHGWVASATTGACFGALYVSFDRWIWRLLERVHGVPNLSGSWSVQGQSSFTNASGKHTPFEGEMTIRQTFGRIHLCAEFAQSTSKSTMAGFQLDGAVTTLTYAFENAPKNLADPTLHRHPGLATATLKNSNTIEVEYFSGKHRLRYGMMNLTRKK